MSIELKITLPLETASKIHAAILNQKDGITQDVVEELEARPGVDSATLLSDAGRAVVKAFKKLPCDIVPKASSAGTAADSTPVLVIPADTPIAPEPANEMTFIIRDTMMKEEQMCLLGNKTMDDLVNKYSLQTGIPADGFYLTFNGKLYSAGLDIDLKKIGMKDGSVLFAFPQAGTRATGPVTPVVSPAYDMKPLAETVIEGNMPSNNINAFTGLELEMEIIVGNIMGRTVTVSIGPHETIEEFEESYKASLNLEAIDLIFKFPNGRSHCARLDKGATLRELGAVDDCLIIAMPERMEL